MKILKSKKALSPVVASIILIAVTVAVSIAVAAWMGALTFTFTKTENIKLPTSTEIKFTPATGSGSPTNSIEMAIENIGTSAVTIVSVKVNGVAKTCNITLPTNVEPATSKSLAIQNVGWIAGYQYRVAFVTSNHNEFFQDYTAPVG